MHKNYLAIDIGASSGRHIVGWMENGVLRTEEVYRFPNSVQRVDGHLEWDIDSLFTNVNVGFFIVMPAFLLTSVFSDKSLFQDQTIYSLAKSCSIDAIATAPSATAVTTCLKLLLRTSPAT